MHRRKDPYYSRAKREGFRSRAAYKLLELQRRYRLLRRGDHVVDLGASPGAWLQVAADLVGSAGRVVGDDISPVRDFSAPNVAVITADATVRATQSVVLEALGRRATVVLSDMAPKLTGVRTRDQVRCHELEDAALDFAVATLADGGRFLAKVLGDAQLLEATRTWFETTKLTRPGATRKGSSECYLIATGFSGPAKG